MAGSRRWKKSSSFTIREVQDTPNLDESLRNPVLLGLTPQQEQQLVAFLKTLTDEEFLTSELFSDPFVTLPGDYDGNGVVDAADYDVWRMNFASHGVAGGGWERRSGRQRGRLRGVARQLWTDVAVAGGRGLACCGSARAGGALSGGAGNGVGYSSTADAESSVVTSAICERGQPDQ